MTAHVLMSQVNNERGYTMQFVYANPLAAVKAANKFEAQGFVVIMSTAKVEDLWGIEGGEEVLTLDVFEVEAEARHVA